jgi:hypothetical protein
MASTAIIDALPPKTSGKANMSNRVARIREQFRALWRSHTSPRRLALALALGVLVGASPLWGLHTLIAVALSMLFGLNKPATVFGTFVSNPISAPFLLFFGLETGSWLLYGRTAPLSLQEIRVHFRNPEWQDLLKEYLLPYCAGSVAVALALAFITFWLSLWLARTYRARSQEAGGPPGLK